MLLTVFIITIVLVALAFAGLGLNILFRKNGKFPQTEVGSNKNMKNRGITCTKQDELKVFRQEKKAARAATATAQLPVRDCGVGCSCISEEF
jgi:flagellar basal body-associated protein FliL